MKTDLRAAAQAMLDVMTGGRAVGSADELQSIIADLDAALAQPQASGQMDPILRQSIEALAAIDEALGLPADGCNSTEQTLEAINELKRRAAPEEDAMQRLYDTGQELEEALAQPQANLRAAASTLATTANESILADSCGDDPMYGPLRTAIADVRSALAAAR